jgi:hypothetical protein
MLIAWRRERENLFVGLFSKCMMKPLSRRRRMIDRERERERDASGRQLIHIRTGENEEGRYIVTRISLFLVEGKKWPLWVGGREIVNDLSWLPMSMRSKRGRM